jgi:hypothetical protein
MMATDEELDSCVGVSKGLKTESMSDFGRDNELFVGETEAVCGVDGVVGREGVWSMDGSMVKAVGCWGGDAC